MCSSAMRSSSRISTPGSRCSATSARVSATSSPARAIPSISPCDLRMITVLRLDLPVPLNLVQRLLDLVKDLFDGTFGVDADDVVPRRAVVLDERCGLTLVELEPPPARFRRVVGASLLGCPAEHPSDPLVAVRYLEVEDDVEAPPELAQELLERLGLRHRPREAVENEAADRVAARQPVADQLDHLLVGYEVAAVVDLTQLLAQLRGARADLPA